LPNSTLLVKKQLSAQPDTDTNPRLKQVREALNTQINNLRSENRDRQKLLREKGDIEGQIRDAERKVSEAKAIASQNSL
jgi:septal ring factor EnvC (AmiA/AmiB activator)